MSKFISTSDKETAEKLKAEGFTQIQDSSTNKYLFVNDAKLNFSEDKDKVNFTNRMCI